MSYFKDIQAGIRTTLKGLSLTFRHIKNATHRRTPQGIADANYFDQQNGLVTLQYPHEQLPIPDNGRYRLRNEIDDCIVCDKCAKVCPVDCITIDAIKATEEVGRASDGSPIRLYAATFDIDMAKCCYCGLCTAVCPTECLTMDKKFDYSEFELDKLTYQFSNLTEEQADEKRSLYEQFLREKEEQKAAQLAAKAASQSATASPATSGAKPKPVFRPGAKPAAPANEPNNDESSAEHSDATPDEMQQIAQGGLEAKKHPVFRPTKKPATPVPDAPIKEHADLPEEEPTAKADDATSKPKAPTAFRPTMKPSKPVDSGLSESGDKPTPEASESSAKPKPAFRPTMKSAKPAEMEAAPEEAPKPKPAFRPTMKPKASGPVSDTSAQEPQRVETDASNSIKSIEEAKSVDSEAYTAPKPKPVFRPTMKPKTAQPSENEENKPVVDVSAENKDSDVVVPPKPKPAFRLTMKPKVIPAADEPAPGDTSNVGATFDEKANESVAEPVKVKPVFRPTMKPKDAQPLGNDDVKPTTDVSAENKVSDVVETPKPVFRPTMKPKNAPVEPQDNTIQNPSAENTETSDEAAPKPKPVFRPTMKPKPAPPKSQTDEDGQSA